MRAYSKDLRDKVVAAYKSGKYNKIELSRLFSISYPTIKRWFQRLETTGSYEEYKPTKPNRKRLFDDKEAIVSYLQSHPDANVVELRNNLAPSVSRNTFYNILNRHKITYKKRNKTQSNMGSKANNNI